MRKTNRGHCMCCEATSMPIVECTEFFQGNSTYPSPPQPYTSPPLRFRSPLPVGFLSIAPAGFLVTIAGPRPLLLVDVNRLPHRRALASCMPLASPSILTFGSQFSIAAGLSSPCVLVFTLPCHLGPWLFYHVFIDPSCRPCRLLPKVPKNDIGGSGVVTWVAPQHPTSSHVLATARTLFLGCWPPCQVIEGPAYKPCLLLPRVPKNDIGGSGVVTWATTSQAAVFQVQAPTPPLGFRSRPPGQLLSGSIYKLSSRLPRVPKNGIGGSGVVTCASAQHPTVISVLLLACLQALEGIVLPFCSSFLGILLLATWQLLCRGLPGQHNPLWFAVTLPCRGLPSGLLVPLGVLGRPVGICSLSWTPWTDRKGRLPISRLQTGPPPSSVVLFRPCCPPCLGTWWLSTQVLRQTFAVSFAPDDLPPVAPLSKNLQPAFPNGRHPGWRGFLGPCDASSSYHLVQRLLASALGFAAGLLYGCPLGDSASRGRTNRLDQEPPSQTPEHRETLDRLREVTTYAHGPWPTLPAAAEAAGPQPFGLVEPVIAEHPAEDLTFGILIPGYAAELVRVSLAPPTEVADALAVLQQERDQVQRRVFPVLTPVRPMPSPNYAVVLAMPSWAHTDVCLCFDLQEIDGRLYADIGPTAADRETLLKLVGLQVDAQVDVYLGASPEPLQAHEVVDLFHGNSIFFLPRHELPGAYYYLEDVLLSAYAWDDEPDFPQGPDDPVLCVVTENGPRLVDLPDLPDPDTFVSPDVLARMLGIPARRLCLQSAVPPITDAAMLGRACRGVYGASDYVLQLPGTPHQAEVPPKLALVDCRGLLQGWDLIASPSGRLPFAVFYSNLDTFTPPGWELYLERAIRQENILQYYEGAVIYASYVPATSAVHMLPLADQHSDSSSAEQEMSFPSPADDSASARSSSSGHSDSAVSSSGQARARSRSPPRAERAAMPDTGQPDRIDHGTGSPISDRTTVFRATFVVLAPGYIPEINTLVLNGTQTWSSLQGPLQAARPALRRQRFPTLLPAQPQPVQDHGLLISLPHWTEEVFAAFDCSQINGAVYTAAVATRVDRATLLATAGFAATSDIEVYVGDLIGPLAATEFVDILSGHCISFLPATGAVLVMSDFEERLADATGWHQEVRLPSAAGEWLRVLTDAGSTSVACPRDSRRFYRQHLAAAFDLPPDGFVLQPARPPVGDSFDQGILADTVCVLTADVLVLRPAAGEPPVIYLLDARPLLAGITWGFAPEGILDEAAILAQCQPLCPPGHHVFLTGGRRDLFGMLRVGAGEVIIADCTLHRNEHPVRLDGPHRRPAPGDGRDPDSPASDAPSAGRSVRRRMHPGPSGSTAATGHAQLSAPSVTNRQAAPLPRSRDPRHSRFQLNAGCLAALLRWTVGAVTVPANTAMYFPGSPAHELPTLPVGRFDKWPLSKCQIARPTGPSVLTPVLPAASSAVPSPATSYVCGPSTHLPPLDAAVSSACRPVPTPCRAKPLSIAPAGRTLTWDDLPDTSIGPTLLEQACYGNAATFCHPFWLTVTLLETLLEHFQTGAANTSPGPSPSPDLIVQEKAVSTSTRIPVSCLHLEQCLPLTPHQRAALALSALLPHSTPVHSRDVSGDWLDADLRDLVTDPKVPLEMRTLFINFRTWYQEAGPSVDAVHIYSDGSAAMSTGQGRPAAWAFSAWARCGSQTLLLGCASSQTAPAGTPYHIGEPDESALTAELLGLAWALAWAADFGLCYASVFHFAYDALSAGCGAFGAACLPSGHYSPLAQLVVYLRQYLEAQACVTHGHVHSHRGHPANELVDQMAKRAARQPPDHWDKCLPTWLPAFAAHPQRAWAWATLPHADLPAFFSYESEASRLQSLPHSDVCPPRPNQHEVSLPSGQVSFSFCAVTYNVLTLRDPAPRRNVQLPTGMRMLGRKGILKVSLDRHAPLFVGLQETRLPDAQSQHDSDYFIFQAPADPAGMGGCALWISRHRTYATQDGQAFKVRLSHITVLSHSSRHLTAVIAAPRLRIMLMVLHAPSLSNHTLATVRQFWRDRALELEKRPKGSEYLLLADTNARLGSIVTTHVGDHAAEDETPAGALLHDFLVRADGFLPATCSNHHAGPSGTWRVPNGPWHRIDYIVVPSAWRHFGLSSKVLCDFESLQARDDHRPVCLTCTFCQLEEAASYWTGKRQAVRPDPSLRECPETLVALQTIPPCPWSIPVDDHYHSLVHAWNSTADQLSQPHADVPQQPYLTPPTLHLVRTRQAFRHYLQEEGRETYRRLTLIAFAAFVHLWRGSRFTEPQQARADAWLRSLDYSVATALSAMHWLGRRLRVMVATDRRAYLDSLVQAAASRDFRTPKELYKAIRKAFPTACAARRSRFQPLPMLETAAGEPAVTSADRAEAWRTHFASQESGSLASPDSYTSTLQRLKECAPAVPFDLSALPTLCKAEQVVLALRHDKAAGPDRLTGETLRLHVPTTTRQLFPVLAKTVLRVREPALWRGGELFVLAKRAGAALTCDAFRSIMVTSVAGKVMHKCLRDTLKPALLAHQPALQGGVRPGLGIETPILAVKTFVLMADSTAQVATMATWNCCTTYRSLPMPWQNSNSI